MDPLPQTAATPTGATGGGSITAEMPAVESTRRFRRPEGIRSLPLTRHAGFAVAVGLAAVLNTHRLSQNGYANVFYSAGVKSMLRSLHNFFFVSFDPGGLITVDKPPLGLWLQALSAKLFGFAPLSLLLPEALVGVLTVAVLYAIVARRLGPVAAFVGSFTLAVFPSFVAVSRDNGVDPLLILLMLLACGTALRACESGRWRWLLGTAVLVGLAFNTKTLAAYLVVPGIAVAYLACAPGTLLARSMRLAVGGLVMLAVSFAWIAAVELTPASHRPYVGGSTNNSELGLTFEYNGFGRVEGQEGGPHQVTVRPGARVPPARLPPPRTAAERARQLAFKRREAALRAEQAKTFLANGRYRNPIPFGSRPSPVRLFGKGLGDQAGWMIPFALFGLFALAALLWPARRGGARAPDAVEAAGAGEEKPAWRRDPRLATLIVLGGWFLVEVAVLSLSKGIVHPYYVSALAPATGAMTGAGASALVALRRRREGRGPLAGIALAVLAALGTVAVQLVLLHREHWMLGLGPVLLIGCAAALLVFGLVRALALPAVALLLALVLIAPTAYAVTTWEVPVEGTFPAAGPKANAGVGGYGVAERTIAMYRAMADYVVTHHPGRRWALLTVASDTSAPFILMGYDVGAVGGYSGVDPALTGKGLARFVRRGEARYVVLGGAYSTRGGNRATQATLAACKQLRPSQWHSPDPYQNGLVLFDCAGRERRLEAAG